MLDRGGASPHQSDSPFVGSAEVVYGRREQARRLVRDIERYESDYLADGRFEPHMVRYRRRQVVSSLMRHPHRRILEVGCGTEPLFEFVDDWDEFTIVEPGHDFARLAGDRAPSGRDVRIVEALLEESSPQLSDRSFDFVVVSSLLHEVRDPTRLLDSVRALCNDETVVHFNVPNARSIHNRLAVRMGLIPDVFAQSELALRMQRTSTYDLASLKRSVEDAGFRVESSGSYFLKPFTHDQIQQMLDLSIIDGRVLDAMYYVSEEFPGAGAEIFVDVRRIERETAVPNHQENERRASMT
jgi:SAM-dependent methyltransferase